MSMTYVSTGSVTKIDMQILRLLAERTELFRRGEAKGTPEQRTAMLTEEAMEMGLDETVVERIVKLMEVLCKQAERSERDL